MIHIGGNYYLDADKYNFILVEKSIIAKGDNKGKESFDNIAYISTHEHVIKELANLALKEGINHDLLAMVELLEGFRASFGEIKKMKRNVNKT